MLRRGLFLGCLLLVLGVSNALEELQDHRAVALGVDVRQKHVPSEFLEEGHNGASVIDPVWRNSEILNPDQRNALELSLQTDPRFEQNARQRFKKTTKGGLASRAITDKSVPYIFMNTLLMALVSGIGAVPFYFVKNLSKKWVGLANAIACGVMLACSFDLIHEGEPHGALLVVLGIGLGMLFVCASQKYLAQFEDIKFENLKGAGARKILLVVGIMAAHAVGEGSGVGVAYSGNRGWSQGVLVTLAIGLHNIPEGLAVATVMVSRGVSTRQATLWAVLTALPQTMFAVPSYLFVETFSASLPIALGFAGGSMVWVVFAELMPDALEDLDHGSVATAATLSAGWLEGLRMVLKRLETSEGTLELPLKASFESAVPVIMSIIPIVLVTTGVCFFIKTTMAPRTGLLGAFIGVQVSFAASSVLWEAFNGAGIAASLLWALCGAAVAIAISVLFLDGGGNKKDEDTGKVSQFRLQAFSLSEDPWSMPAQVMSWQPSARVFGNSGTLALILLSTCLLLAFSEGMTSARAIINNLEHLSSVMVPGIIAGALFGIIAGLSMLLIPMRTKSALLMSIFLGGFSSVVSLLCLLQYPLDHVNEVVSSFDTFNHIGKLSVFVGGILVGVNFSFVWPFFASLGVDRARNGLICGLAFGSLAKIVLGGLCLGTPYCLA